MWLKKYKKQTDIDTHKTLKITKITHKIYGNHKG